MPEEKVEHLTPAQKEQLEGELAELEGPRRKAIVEAIATARGFGDLSENFEYHAAKNEQGLLERRITLLRDRLSRAVVIEDGAGPRDTIGVGSKVVIEDERGERRAPQLLGHPSSWTTFVACGPFSPSAVSNSTFAPSGRDLNPSPEIALWWTKRSLPDPSSGEMNPYPFESLNHFTVPVAMNT